MTLGARIRELRRARGFTQRALAGADLSESFISMVEHDKARPSLESLRLLADRLDVPLSTLLEDRPHPAEAEAHLRHGDVLLRQHQFTSALEHYQAAQALADRTDDPRRRAEAHLGMGQALLGLRQFDLAESHLQQAETQAEPLGDSRLRALVAQACGLLAIRQRRFSAARTHLVQAITLIRQTTPPDRRLEAIILTNLGRVYINLTLPMQALECFEGARPLLEAAADPIGLAMLQVNSGMAYAQQQAFDDAAREFRQAAEFLLVQENLQLLGGVKRNLGMLLLDRGDAAAAEPLLRQSLTIARQLADDAGQAHTLTELARAVLSQGRIGEAEEAAAAARRLARHVKDPAEAALATMVLAAAAHRRQRLEEAGARYREAADAFWSLEMVKEAGEALRELGFVYLDAGREGEAAHAFAQAFTAQKTLAAAQR